MKLSLVVPCYNEQDNVELFYEECVKAFCGKGFDYEFVFVNDGSRDETLNRLKKLYNEKTESNITVVSFSRNFGKESAIFAGIKNSVCSSVPRSCLKCSISSKLSPNTTV